MNKNTAIQIAQYFQGQAKAADSEFAIQRLRGTKPLDGFHEFADGLPLIAADQVERSDGSSVVCLLIKSKAFDIKSKNPNEWYLVVCSPATHAPLVEIWREEKHGSVLGLTWRYSPTIRDGRNPERKQYFQTHVGDLMMCLSVPGLGEVSSRFIEDIFDLVDNRQRAHDLDADEPNPRQAFPEGEMLERLHKARERNPAVVRLAKLLATKKGGLSCQICGFDFERKYGQIGHGYIEGHHTVPVSELTKGAHTRPEDIALVCANCHRMLHRKRPWLTMDELTKILASDEQDESALIKLVNNPG